MNSRIPPFHWWRTVFYLIPAIALYTIVLGTLSLASSLFQKTGYFAHWCARTWSRLILMTTRVHVEVAGLDRLERDRTYVFVSNHQSHYDTAVLFATLPHQLRIIAKESLGRFPFIGWHLRRTGHILVDRRRPDRSAIFGWAERLLALGLSLIVYPEGTRSADGTVHRFKPGSFQIDATVGGGGHAARILEAAKPDGHLLGLDADPLAIARARRRLAHAGERVTLRQANFEDIGEVDE